MITNWLKSPKRFFDSISSEVEYWKQLENLQAKVDKAEFELKNVQAAFKKEQDYSCFMALRATKFENEVEDLKSELGDSRAAYNSLLKDYHEMMDKHRSYKRELQALIEQLKEPVRTEKNL